jgi:hypothetical protein
MPLNPCLQTAQRFAAALDTEDYEGAAACLSLDCTYHAPDGKLIGPSAIVGSYRENAEAGRKRFDKVEYKSLVESIGATEAVVTFTDKLQLGGSWHEFRCRQHLRISSAGLIEEIGHEELPGERQRLQHFEARRQKSASGPFAE